MVRESIVDASRPNAGRVYDYILGGHHNFEVDRMAAEQIIQYVPFTPKACRLQRWCLQDIAVELTEKRGYDLIIDFASGLPTNDHIHYVVPEGTTVIYSDYDPVVVEYAREILGNTPNVYFFEADARRPEEFLNRPEVQQIIGNRRDVAIVYWSVAAFLTVEEIAHAARALYDWSGPKSCWAFHAQGAGSTVDDPDAVRLRQVYAQMGSPIYARTLEDYQEAVAPWKVDEKGYVSLLDWHGLDQSIMTDEDRRAIGAAGGGYAGYLNH